MNYVACRYCLVAFTAISLGAPSFWIATRPSRPTSRLGMRGKKRQQALLRNPTWASIEPLVRWMGVRVNGVLPETTYTKLDTLITHAGDYLGLTADEAFGSMILTAILAAAMSAAIAGAKLGLNMALLVLPSAVLLGGALPYMILDGARKDRMRTINRTLPNVIDLLSLGMSAGLDFPGSVAQLVERSKLPEVVRDELEYLLQQLQLGHTRAAVLRELASRAPIELVKEFSQSVIQAEERGNPMAATLEIQAQIARTRRTNIAEKTAEDMKGRMIVPIAIIMCVNLALIYLPSQMLMGRVMGNMLHR
jgi:tight adherence protein C